MVPDQTRTPTEHEIEIQAAVIFLDNEICRALFIEAVHHTIYSMKAPK